MSMGNYPTPTTRRLRVYAFDPSASVELSTAVINDALLTLAWNPPWEDSLELGPTNEYLEVVDYDFPARTFYEPVDLNDPLLLAQDGLPPSEGCPQFHQQMVFAVAMYTIRNFEHALGRYVFWSKPAPKQPDGTASGRRGYAAHEKRLRIYPHAMREANAYYSPDKAALLFGYFKSPPEDGVPEGQWVFTCLSQDIVAHETTHAILHGLRKRSVDPVNPDSLALHEGFADIVALLQHFTLGNVVEHELARNAGKLRSVNLLTGLASQFGKATGRNGALRLALDTLSKEASGEQPKIKLLSESSEAHDRGSVLVAAVFDAFITIFERRTADLFQIAGAIPGKGPMTPQLVTRLAEEASRTANSVLQMCVRGLDYLPPVGPTFGEYLRAIITADTDLVPDDPYKYRVAFAEAFRKRAIPVPHVISYAPEALCWERPAYGPEGSGADELAVEDGRRRGLFADAMAKLQLGLEFGPVVSKSEAVGSDSAAQKRETSWVEDELRASPYRTAASSREDVQLNLREEAMRIVSYNQAMLHNWLATPTAEAPDSGEDEKWEKMLGIRMLPITSARPAPLSINSKEGDWKVPSGWSSEDKKRFRSHKSFTIPIFDVHSVRIARRTGPHGMELHHLIAQITQRRRGYFDEDEQKRVDRDGSDAEPDFWFRGGATVIVDLRNAQVQRVIRKRIDDDERLAEQRSFLLGDELALAMVTDDAGIAEEPFAFMHGDEA
jgi:hypothetical protein